MVELCGYGQSVEEDEEHHHPVETLGFHINQALHPKETVPASSQTAKHKHSSCSLFKVTTDIALIRLQSKKLTSSR